jgi:hypothetical protein
MQCKICSASLLAAALGIFPVSQGMADGEAEVDNRPNYNGPYRYPKEPANTPYGMPYGAAPCAYTPCGVAPYGNTYYEHNRDGSGYMGYGVPDSAGDASQHQWETPYRLRREANRDDRPENRPRPVNNH